MFKDERRYEVWSQIRQHDLRAFSKLLTPGLFVEVARRAGVRLVHSPLCPLNFQGLRRFGSESCQRLKRGARTRV